MADKVFLIDGFDTSTLEFVVSEVQGWRDGANVTWNQKPVPGRIGTLITGLRPLWKPRELTVVGTLLASSVANLILANDEMKWRLGTAARTFTFVDDETREFNGRMIRYDAPGIQPHMVQLGVQVRIKIQMTDPRVFAASTTNVGSITSATDLPLGTAPVWATVQVTGSGSFTLTYKDHTGTTKGTMTITGATAPVNIDMDAQTITDAGGNAVEYLTAGDFFAYDPEHADDIFGSPDWPTLEVTSGTGSTSYEKAYY